MLHQIKCRLCSSYTTKWQRQIHRTLVQLCAIRTLLLQQQTMAFSKWLLLAGSGTRGVCECRWTGRFVIDAHSVGNVRYIEVVQVSYTLPTSAIFYCDNGIRVYTASLNEPSLHEPAIVERVGYWMTASMQCHPCGSEWPCQRERERAEPYVNINPTQNSVMLRADNGRCSNSHIQRPPHTHTQSLTWVNG